MPYSEWNLPFNVFFAEKSTWCWAGFPNQLKQAESNSPCRRPINVYLILQRPAAIKDWMAEDTLKAQHVNLLGQEFAPLQERSKVPNQPQMVLRRKINMEMGSIFATRLPKSWEESHEDNSFGDGRQMVKEFNQIFSWGVYLVICPDSRTACNVIINYLNRVAVIFHRG